jgi:hypothetical protein
VEKYVAALDDPAMPDTQLQWEGRNRIRIRTVAAPGQVLSVQDVAAPGPERTL